MSDPNREKQIAEAEELLGGKHRNVSFAKQLFFGRQREQILPRYPDIHASRQAADLVKSLQAFCRDRVDPVAIDRNERIPDEVIAGLGRLGVLGACLPTSCGGRGFSQTEYCRLIEVLGGHCASTALFVNAHHSIGPRSIVLFGTPQQQQQWLPKLASGEWISAFALTEPEAGSDAANVQTMATPSADGRGWVLNGQKRWITNGGIAQALTVMARTPMPGGGDTKITAFLVSPDMPGFQVVEERMPKCGVRGTATSRLAFKEMFVPNENVLGKLGKGLKVALTVLDFGRTTFGASCTGAAKFCMLRAARHAATRVQFGQALATFDLVRDKLAYMHAGTFAMEAATYQTAALIDSGGDDYMLETAMLKVFATDVLWRIINDTIQIFGGKAYFNDEPYERMMRDGRINLIGEGANDVLRSFVALVGMREVGLELKGIVDALFSPFQNLSKIGRFAGRRIESTFGGTHIAVRSAELHSEASKFGRTFDRFGKQIERLLRKHREAIVDHQYQMGRIGEAAIELYVSACVLSRLDALLSGETHGGGDHNGHDGSASDAKAGQLIAGRYYLQTANRRIRRNLADLWDNDDPETTRCAAALLGFAAPQVKK